MNFIELEKKIKSMTAKEIIMSLIDGLKNPVLKIDINTYGAIKYGICYGCGATNAICKIGGLKPEDIFDDLMINDPEASRKYNNSSNFLNQFETSLNELRMGDISWYNWDARRWGFSTITIPDIEGYKLTEITNDNYYDEEVLNEYIELANYQK